MFETNPSQNKQGSAGGHSVTHHKVGSRMQLETLLQFGRSPADKIIHQDAREESNQAYTMYRGKNPHHLALDLYNRFSSGRGVAILEAIRVAQYAAISAYEASGGTLGNEEIANDDAVMIALNVFANGYAKDFLARREIFPLEIRIRVPETNGDRTTVKELYNPRYALNSTGSIIDALAGQAKAILLAYEYMIPVGIIPGMIGAYGASSVSQSAFMSREIISGALKRALNIVRQ